MEEHTYRVVALSKQNGVNNRWTEAVDRPPPDGNFICHRSVIGAVYPLKNEP